MGRTRTRRVGCVLAAAAGVLLAGSAATAGAGEDPSGFYIGLELGLANSSSVDSTVIAVNHPTRCDSLLYPEGISPPNDAACTTAEAKPLFANSFDPDAGFAGGVALGYSLDRLRFEIEFLNRNQGTDSVALRTARGNVALTGKDSEWAIPPSERISEFRARQVFANAYYDFKGDSAWTPYAGAGVGWARTRLRYTSSLRRKPEQEYLAVVSLQEGWPEGSEPAQRAAAGTLSYMETEVSDDLFGFQALAGVDYALSEKVSLGLKARWARFEDLKDDALWDLIRSHEPVQADGVTPFTSRLEFDDIEYWGVTLALKYRF